MGVRVNWWDETEQILHYEFHDPWTWHDYERALTQGRALMREKPHPVCIINNLLDTHKFPGLIISRMKRYIETRPANTGLVVFVTESFFIHTIIQTFHTIYPRLAGGYVLAPTTEDAVAQINSWRADPTPFSETGHSG